MAASDWWNSLLAANWNWPKQQTAATANEVNNFYIQAQAAQQMASMEAKLAAITQQYADEYFHKEFEAWKTVTWDTQTYATYGSATREAARRDDSFNPHP